MKVKTANSSSKQRSLENQIKGIEFHINVGCNKNTNGRLQNHCSLKNVIAKSQIKNIITIFCKKNITHHQNLCLTLDINLKENLEMKKLLLPMLASVASIAIADAAPFNGFYAGAQAGLERRTSTSTITNGYSPVSGVSGTPATYGNYINFTKKDKKNGLMYGLFAGWGKVVANGFYAGAEAVL
jgi:hypothetical protein